ncbi:MAG: DUF3488 domain-containing protein [Pirellulaceae bacterium]|nr:DUF3488 domain-containing protein [Pirellulaceae bacterium]
MNRNRRSLEILFLSLVVVSAFLLGMGQGNIALSVIAISLAVAAWIFVDWLKLFRIPRWVANVVSIGILIWTMSYFFEAQSGAQLIAVANLLVYLQSLILFQEKTPRQYWQLIILNVLQVVVAAVFSLDLEGGLVFLIYMVLAAFFLFFLSNEDVEHSLQETNDAGTLKQGVFPFFIWREESRPSGMKFEYPHPPFPHQFFRISIGHLVPAILACFTFAMILLVLIPRAPDSWVASRVMQASSTGVSRSIQLDSTGVINYDFSQVMRVKFSNIVTGEPIEIAGNPYFRGMALPQLIVRNNVTIFEAPHDRVFYNDYESIPKISYRESRLPAPFVNADYILEPTNDPLVFCTMPLFLPLEDSISLEVCRPLSAVVRPRPFDFIEYAPYRYTLVTRINSNNQMSSAFPFVSPDRSTTHFKMEPEDGEHRSLTYLPAERYPDLIKIAQDMAQNVPSRNPLEFGKRIESYFVNSPSFKYTLDFTTITRNQALDPIEDFVANHRTGHCQMYAAAMVLMLRSQGIPARIVVGFCGGDWMGDSYSVLNKYAHAWVEAYVPPEFCTEEMFRNGEAGRGGAWVRFDPTPPQGIFANGNRGGNSLQLARSLWQDYVMGMEDRSGDSMVDVPAGRLANALNLGQITESAQAAVVRVQTNPLLQAVVISASILVLVVLTIVALRKNQTKSEREKKHRAGPIRRLAATLLSIISSDLGRWVLADSESKLTVPFYEKFVGLLKRHGYNLDSSTTHREFANQVVDKLMKYDIAPPTQDIVLRLTEDFQAVRFGKKTLDRAAERRLWEELKILESALQDVSNRERTALPAAH